MARRAKRGATACFRALSGPAICLLETLLGERVQRAVAAGVAYGPEVEMDTSRQAAQPFLHSDLDGAVPDVRDHMMEPTEAGVRAKRATG